MGSLKRKWSTRGTLLQIINSPNVAGAVLQTPLSLADLFRHSSFVEISVRRRHALMVEDGAFSHKIDC